MSDRLDEIRKRYAGVPYIDADKDILWLIAEVDRLRQQLAVIVDGLSERGKELLRRSLKPGVGEEGN